MWLIAHCGVQAASYCSGHEGCCSGLPGSWKPVIDGLCGDAPRYIYWTYHAVLKVCFYDRRLAGSQARWPLCSLQGPGRSRMMMFPG